MRLEFARAGATPDRAAAALTQLSDPAPDWVALAAGTGVPASRAHTADELGDQLRRALGVPSRS